MKRFPRLITRFRYVFVSMFVAFVGFSGGYWLLVQRPAERCEASGNWWDPQSRVCGTVVYLPDLTGRYEIEGREWRPAVQGQRTAPAPARPAAS